jgi:hypothetical protein
VRDVRAEMIGDPVEAHAAAPVHAALAVCYRESAPRQRDDGAGDERPDEHAPFAAAGSCLLLHIRLLVLGDALSIEGARFRRIAAA